MLAGMHASLVSLLGITSHSLENSHSLFSRSQQLETERNGTKTRLNFNSLNIWHIRFRNTTKTKDKTVETVADGEETKQLAA